MTIPPTDRDSLRRWYAGLAMIVLAQKADRVLRCPKDRVVDIDVWRPEMFALVAKKSFILADAMMKEGEK